MYWDLFNVDPLAIQRFTKKYGYTTALSVNLEGATNLYYTTLPANIVPFRDKASGIRRISTVVQGGATFYPMDNREMDLILSGSYVHTLRNKIGYVVTDRIDYYNMTASIVATGVRADIIVPFSVYTDNEVVLLPEIWGADNVAFLDRVLKHLREVQPVNLVENPKEEVR
jgi:hypothetical protein